MEQMKMFYCQRPARRRGMSNEVVRLPAMMLRW